MAQMGRPAMIKQPLTDEQRRVVEENLPLVWLVIRKTGWIQKHIRKLERDQEGSAASFGYEGLMDAARKFDPSRDIKFSTYATQLIAYAISRGSQGVGKVQALRKDGDHVPQCFAMSSFATDDDGVDMAGAIPAREEEGRPYEPADVAALLEAARSLPRAWRRVLRMRFVERKTLKEVAERIGRTKERVRQLQNKAIETLQARLAVDGLGRVRPRVEEEKQLARAVEVNEAVLWMAVLLEANGPMHLEPIWQALKKTPWAGTKRMLHWIISNSDGRIQVDPQRKGARRMVRLATQIAQEANRE